MSVRQTISRALDEHCDQLHPEQARRIIAALDAAGFTIVPREATDEMAERGVEFLHEYNRMNGPNDAKEMYRVMIMPFPSSALSAV